MKRLTATLLGVFVICAMTYASFSEKHFVILFPTDSFSLDATAAAELEEVAAFTNGKYFELMLDAHTDDVGTSQYNIELSKNRAFSVHDFLVAKGMDESRMEYSWFGEARPISTNKTDEGKQANRRVTVIVKVYEWKSAQDVLNDVSENRQEFTIDPQEKSMIETAGGIKIEIPGNALVTADGLPLIDEDVTVVLTEALSRESWLQEGLSTVSPEGLLESGGMFKIEALRKGEPLALEEGSQINVLVPFQSPEEGMSLFYANRDDNGSTVWQKSEQPVKAQLNIEPPGLKMDMAKLNALIIKYGSMNTEYPKMDSSFFSLTPQPQFKLAPPRMPRKPVKEDIRVHVTKMKSLFMTKKQEAALAEKAYQRRMQVYDKNLAYYHKRVQYYNRAKERFDKSMEEFNAKQPEYERQISNALSMMDSLRVVFDKNVASARIHRCLVAIKSKLSNGQITEPYYLTSLINTYGDRWFYNDLDDVNYSPYPEEVKAIRTKLEALNIPQSKYYTDISWAARYQFRELWRSDEQLMSLLNESEKKLMQERFAKGLANYNDLNGYYSTSLSNLGWINLDRFSKMKLTASINIKQEPGSRVFIVFDNTNSVLEYWGESMNMPRNVSVTVFSVMLKDNLPHYAISRVNLKEKTTRVELKYKEGLLDDIKSAIKQVV